MEGTELVESAPIIFQKIDNELKLLCDTTDNRTLTSLIQNIENFQEGPQYLDSKIGPWMEILVEQALKDLQRDSWVYRVIYTLSKVRGYKVISRFYPNEAHLLTVLVKSLQSCDNFSWEHRYCLLLWTSILILIPLPLSSYEPSTLPNLYAIARKFQGVAGKERDASCLLLARLLARVDVIELGYLEKYVDTCLENWTKSNLFERLGYLQCCTFLLNLVVNDSSVHRMLPILIECAGDNNSLIGKLAAKNLGRICLNLMNSGTDQENVEEILDTLLLLLESKDTIVRYTTSKAISRIIYRLPDDLQEEVVVLMLDLFTKDLYDNDYSRVSSNLWHGLLLTVAELSRRKILSQSHLLRVVAILKIALFFEQKQITHAVGTNVRDASCYVCWSVFRSYEKLPSELLGPMFENLVLLCCFDREVTIRRAASAAVQEGIGRHNNHFELEKGINIVQLLDYFKLGSRSYAILEVSSALSNLGFDIISDVTFRVANSWDPEMRRLYSRALKSLVKDEGTVSTLVSLYNKNDIDAKHGVLLALGEVGFNGPLAVKLLRGIEDEELKFDNGPLVAEGFLSVLRNLPPLERKEPVLMKKMSLCLEFTETSVVKYAKEAINNLSPPDEIIRLWLERAKDSTGCFLQCLGAFSPPTTAIIHGVQGLSRSHDVKTRSEAIRSLHELTKHAAKLESFDLSVFVNGLSDYTVDSRGDVGSWVRIGSIEACGDIYPGLDSELKARVLLNLVRMSVEVNNNVRQIAYQCLCKLSIDILVPIIGQSNETTQQYYEMWLNVYEVADEHLKLEFTKGLVTSVGGTFASETTLKDSKLALVTYLRSKSLPERKSVVNTILACFSTRPSIKVIHCLLNTLLILLQSGLEFPTFGEDGRFHNVLYSRVSFITQRSKNTAILLLCVRILGELALLENRSAVTALGNLCGHRFPAIRLESSETLYQVLSDMGNEAGIIEVLEDTDWGQPLDVISGQYNELETFMKNI